MENPNANVSLRSCLIQAALDWRGLFRTCLDR